MRGALGCSATEMKPSRHIGSIRAGVFLLTAVIAAACSPTPAARDVMDACATLPIGAIAPAPPLSWCDSLPPANTTATIGANSWRDDFAGAPHSALPKDYLVFEAIRYASKTYGPSAIVRSQHFVHNGHWMVDLESVGSPPGEYEGDLRDLATGTNFGGAAMRPRNAFSPSDGRLVVEADVSAAMAAYNNMAWPEIVITTAPAPTGRESDAIHALGVFGGAWAFGCRLEPSRSAACELRDPAGHTLAAAQSLPELVAWRKCALDAPDATCRDRFRLELVAQGGSLSVNGAPLRFDGPLAAVPTAFLAQPLYVYFASWAYLATGSYLRLHWGRVAVNP